MIDSKLSLKPHLANIKKKFTFISQKFLPFRLRRNEKFNMNMFRTLIDPLFRLISGLISFAKKGETNFLKVQYNMMLKSFCLLSKNTPNNIT